MLLPDRKRCNELPSSPSIDCQEVQRGSEIGRKIISQREAEERLTGGNALTAVDTSGFASSVPEDLREGGSRGRLKSVCLYQKSFSGSPPSARVAIELSSFGGKGNGRATGQSHRLFFFQLLIISALAVLSLLYSHGKNQPTKRGVWTFLPVDNI